MGRRPIRASTLVYERGLGATIGIWPLYAADAMPSHRQTISSPDTFRRGWKCCTLLCYAASVSLKVLAWGDRALAFLKGKACKRLAANTLALQHKPIGHRTG